MNPTLLEGSTDDNPVDGIYLIDNPLQDVSKTKMPQHLRMKNPVKDLVCRKPCRGNQHEPYPSVGLPTLTL